jgi:hypothetical protein
VGSINLPYDSTKDIIGGEMPELISSRKDTEKVKTASGEVEIRVHQLQKPSDEDPAFIVFLYCGTDGAYLVEGEMIRNDNGQPVFFTTEDEAVTMAKIEIRNRAEGPSNR